MDFQLYSLCYKSACSYSTFFFQIHIEVSDFASIKPPLKLIKHQNYQSLLPKKTFLKVFFQIFQNLFLKNSPWLTLLCFDYMKMYSDNAAAVL